MRDRIDFTSVSADPDDPIVAQAWDLDGDGQYDDASGATASQSFSTAGPHTVRLRVTDSRGRTAAASANVAVTTLPVPPPKKISPWPKIRIVGFAGRKRVRRRPPHGPHRPGLERHSPLQRTGLPP